MFSVSNAPSRPLTVWLALTPKIGAAVELAELVAVDRVVEEIGEVVEQRQVLADDVGLGLGLRVALGAGPAARQAVAARLAAVGRIERAEAADHALSIARCATWSVEVHLLVRPMPRIEKPLSALPWL